MNFFFKHTSLTGFCFLEGKKHDARMLADSGLLYLLQRHAVSPFGQPMYIYADPAYPLRLHLQMPFRNAVLTPDMQALNASISAVRVSVKCLFFSFFSNLFISNKNLKIGLSDVGKIYIYGNLTSEYLTVTHHHWKITLH